MNQNNEDRQLFVFEIDANDDETDVVFLEQAYAYHQQLVAEENHLPLTRNPINRDREGAEERLMADYFNDHCRVRPDATGRMSLSVIMKCTAAIRQLAYGTTPDAFDEYLQMSERTALSWQGQYGRGDKKYPTIMLEAVASQDLWIWHAFFGVAGANNDINVLDNSPLFDDLLNDTAPVVPYVVNGVGYEKGYYLADGIYPQWATFVKSFTVANDAKHAYIKKRQEGAQQRCRTGGWLDSLITVYNFYMVSELLALDMPIKSSLLSRETLLDVKDTFAIVSKEKSHKGITSSSAGSSSKPQVSSFVAKSNNLNNNGNKKIDNNKKFESSVNPSNNIGQYGRIIDISDLNLTVGHPNGTMAKIKYVGNLKLSENVVLFDVLVVPEYSVGLLYVNKLIKDSRMFVGFTETRCYIQDLHLNKIVRTGSENGGLYMFDTPSSFSSTCQTLGNLFGVCFVSKSLWHTSLGHPSDQAVDMLHHDLNFTKDSQVSPCDICHKAKQIREPFHFSDHQTTTIGELIHLDLWDPYKVLALKYVDLYGITLVYISRTRRD
ncbi:ALP1-like protein isoform X1 [Tanacetum coccineum]